MRIASNDVRFSNRPFEVKRFQAIHLCGVDVTRGLVLLFGIGTARDIFPPLGGARVFLLSGLILAGFHAAAAAFSRVHRNSVPSTQMRCIITASRRARATIAFFIPRRLAICMAHALSQDHFFECIML